MLTTIMKCFVIATFAMIHYRSLFEELVQVPTVVERKEVA